MLGGAFFFFFFHGCSTFYLVIIRIHLIDYNSNYIRICICITRNKRYCNIIFIIIHLFSDNTIIEL